MEKADKEMLLNLIRRRCREAGTQAKWAEQQGITPQYVTDILQGRRDISANIAKALGYELVVTVREIRNEDAF